ncbi:hypothetical protein AB0H92_10845 [Streptomyces phaeochromogenes]|uniref:hypothetical protein n=1 Tax=Streptomyces phaeochromogenes TaxID=1923 RepID=UPI0033EC7436
MKTEFPSLPNDRTSRLIIALTAGILVFGLVVVFALLAADVAEDSGSSSRRCPGVVGTVDPVTCLPYGSGAAAAPGTNTSGSIAQKPKAPAAKVPAAPKGPAAPAPKAPAAPPVRITK